MKATYLSLILSFATLALLASCGPDAIPKGEVTALELSHSTASIQQGETLQLTATTTPTDAKVLYVSDNPSVASVSETGLVKALTPGMATITAQAGEKKAACKVTVLKAGNVSLLNKLDQKKYPSGSTIDYVASITKEEAEFYDLQLAFSVLKTANYTLTMTFDKAISGSVCIGDLCQGIENETSHTEDLPLTADAESSNSKEKGDPTSLGTHLILPTASGEVYKNRFTIKLTPKDGSEPFEWTVNLAISVQ